MQTWLSRHIDLRSRREIDTGDERDEDGPEDPSEMVAEELHSTFRFFKRLSCSAGSQLSGAGRIGSLSQGIPRSIQR